MFAHLLATLFLLAALVFLILAYQVDEQYRIGMIPALVGAAVVYILSPQLNWWRYRRRPLPLEPEQTDLLERHCVFYQGLSPAEKQRFRDRIVLFRMGTDWMPMGWPEEALPPDVKLALAAQAVTVTFGKPSFLFDQFEKVIVYPYPFPSPEHPYLHASELYAEDGCLLFSADQLMPAFLQPGQRYNIGLHEYARAFAITWPEEPFPAFEAPDVWEKLESVSRLTRDKIETTVGLAGVEALPVAIHHYFTYPERFRAVFPEEAVVFDQMFKSFSH